MKQVTINLIVDAAIGAAFALSAVSGLVFLLPQDAATVPMVLGLDLLMWSDLHTIASLVMIGGVLLHLALHARWIGANVRRGLVPARVPVAADAITINRRHITRANKRGVA